MATPIDVTSVWGAGLRRLTIGLVLSITLVALESLSVATILPVIGRQLGDVRLYGWVFSAFFLASLLGVVGAGDLADRYGVRLPLLAGLALFGAGLAVAGAAANMPVLVLGRVVQGLGAGAVPATAYVAIGRSYPERLRPRMLATMSTAWVLPSLVGPSLAAQVASSISWRAVFLGLLPLVVAGGALIVAALAAVPHTTPVPTRRPPVLSALATTAGAAALLGGLTILRPAPTALLVAAGGILALGGLRRLTPSGTLTAQPGLPAAVVTRGLLTLGFFAVDAYVPLTLTSVHHTSTSYAGLTMTVGGVVWTLGSWTQARVVRQRGPRAMIRIGLSLVAVGIAGMGLVLAPAVGPWAVFVAWPIACFGIGLAYTPISLTALDRAEPGGQGHATAAVQLTDTLGTALGTGLAGAFVAFGHLQRWPARIGLGWAFGTAVTVILAALVLSPRLPTTLGSRPADASAGGVEHRPGSRRYIP